MDILEVSGDSYEMGLLQGEKLSQKMRKAFRDYISAPYFKNAKPLLVPFGIFVKIAKKRAAEAILDLLDFTPRIKERFFGVVKGSGMETGEIALMSAGEVLLNEVPYTLGGCTGIAVMPERSKTGEMIVMKNFDYPVEFLPYNLLRISRPRDGYSSAELTMTPLAGSHDGMNEKGLVILYNYGLSFEKGEKGPLITALIQESLEECGSVECVVRKFEGKRFPSSAILMVADGKNALVMEITPRHFGIREPERGYLVMTNHFRTPQVKPYDIPSEAVFSKKAIKELRGVRVHQSDELRYERAVELIEDFGKVGLDEVMKILRDHGKDGVPSDDTICRHAYPYSTIGSAVFLPNSKKVLYKSGNPCEGEYDSLRL